MLRNVTNPAGRGWHFDSSREVTAPWLIEQVSGCGFTFKSTAPVATLRFQTPTFCKLWVLNGVLGPKPRGLGLFAVGFEVLKSHGDLLGDPFLVTFAEDPDAALARFNDWFEKLVTIGLNRWREIHLK